MLKLKMVGFLIPLLFLAGCGGHDQNPMAPLSTSLIDTLASDTAGVVGKPGAELSNARDRSQFAFPGGDWSSRVVWEARYAMSNMANGTSRWPVSSDKYGPRWVGDWSYTGNFNGQGNDPYALSKAIEESFGYVGTIGNAPPPQNYHYSGWCTFFARFVLFRSTYWAGYGAHLTLPNFNGRDPGGVYGWCDSNHMAKDFRTAKPGWLGFRPPSSIASEHVLILDRRETVNGSDGWWVIDGNYVGSFIIGRHFMPMSVLNQYYWAWCPTLATSN